MKKFTIIIGIFIAAFPAQSQISDSLKQSVPQRQVIETSGSNFDWNNILAAAIGGFIGLIPSILSLFKRVQIKGKIISQYHNISNLPGQVGQSVIYLQKLSIFSSRKNFSLRDINIYIKFKHHPEIECTLWTWRRVTFTFLENGINVQKHLAIPPNEYILHYTLLPKDESQTGYISFTHDNVVNDQFEYIRYIFIDFKEHKKELRITDAEIKSNTLVHDDAIWV